MFDVWYKELGFYSNPFSIKPAAFTNDVVGHNLKAVFKEIDAGRPLFIVGPFGTGKTTLLKHIIGKYGGEGKVVYFSCSMERSMDVDKLLRGAGSLLQRIAGQRQREVIFLVDEANDLLARDAQDLYDAYKEGAIRSIVFVGTDIPSRRLPAGLGSDLKNSIINVHTLPSAAAVSLVRKRIGNLSLVPDQIIKDVHKRAEGNTRLMLEYLEELCRMAVQRGIDKLTKDETEELLPKPKQASPKPKLKETKAKHRVNRPLEQSIEEAVFEVEDDAPIVEGIAPIREDDPLPRQGLYDSPLKKGKASKRKR